VLCGRIGIVRLIGGLGMDQITHTFFSQMVRASLRLLLPAFVSMLVLPSVVLAADKAASESATVIEATHFHVEPAGTVIRSLPANTLVQVEKRDRGWYRVKLTDGHVGYVRLATLRLGEEQASESVFSGMWSWLNDSRRSQSEMSTATAGVRGFDEADLQAAEPDHEAVKKLTGLAAGKQTAESYARAIALTARPVEELGER
jgi:hypothetical protein